MAVGSLLVATLGLNFGFKNPLANPRDGATTLSLTLGFRMADRALLGQIESLADRADTSTAEGIEALARDTSLLLLRRRSEWVACSGNCVHYGDDDRALGAFDRAAIKEAAKFDEDEGGFAGDASSRALSQIAEQQAPSSVAVICAVACVLGDKEEAIGSKEWSGSAPLMLNALEELAASASAEGEVFAFELLWVPSADSGTSLQMDEVLLDWPELMPC